MNTLSYKSVTPKAADIKKEWILVDAENEILGADLFRNLRVFAGAEHPHEAQQPKKININEIK